MLAGSCTHLKHCYHTDNKQNDNCKVNENAFEFVVLIHQFPFLSVVSA